MDDLKQQAEAAGVPMEETKAIEARDLRLDFGKGSVAVYSAILDDGKRGLSCRDIYSEDGRRVYLVFHNLEGLEAFQKGIDVVREELKLDEAEGRPEVAP